MAGAAQFFSIAVSPGGDIYGSPCEIGAISTSSYPNFIYAARFPVLTASGTVQDEQATWLPPFASSSLPGIAGGVAFDTSGNFYYADEDGNRILKIRPGVDVTVFAGIDTVASRSDGVGTSAAFHGPTSLAADAAGNLIVNNFGNGAIRRISPDGTVTTITTGSMGRYLAVDGGGNIFVDFVHSIKRVDVYGNVTTFPLPGVTDAIYGMVADQCGNLYLSTSGVGAQIWRVSF